MSSFKDLVAQREKLDSQINAMMQREKAEGISKAKEIIEQSNTVEVFIGVIVLQ
jgi:DNA-binding protein H-NS